MLQFKRYNDTNATITQAHLANAHRVLQNVKCN